MAENCTTVPTQPGRNLLVEYAVGCGEDVPTSKTYNKFGSINSKQLSSSASTSSDRSDVTGGFETEVVIARGKELTVSGFVSKDNGVEAAQMALIQYIEAEEAAGRQPTVWIKVSGQNFPLVYHMFMNAKDYNIGADDLQTIEFSFGLANTQSSTNLPVQISAAV